jgi:hypothetical protein
MERVLGQKFSGSESKTNQGYAIIQGKSFVHRPHIHAESLFPSPKSRPQVGFARMLPNQIRNGVKHGVFHIYLPPCMLLLHMHA